MTTTHRPPTVREDLVGALAELDPATAEARLAKPEVVRHTQLAHNHLFTDPGRLSLPLRRALAARVADQHGAPQLAAHHRRHDAVDLAVATADPSVAALVRHADLLSLSPAVVTPADVAALADAGLDPDGIVLLAQVVAVTAYEARLVSGLRLISGHHDASAGLPGRTDDATAGPSTDRPGRVDSASVELATTPPGRTDLTPAAPATDLQGRTIDAAAPVPSPGPPEPTEYAPDLAPNGLAVPRAYTREQLGWLPWVEPIPTEDLTDEHRAAFAGKNDGAYFRLLGRQTGVLAARTQIDHAVFLTRVGLPRAERELAAAVTSKVNDCIFCASVHARKAAQMSKRPDDVDRLLAADVPRGAGWAPTDLAALSAGHDERWAAVIDFAAALAASPSRATAAQVARLQELGLEALELVDLVASVAFFSWANRLMLTLGEPYVPEHDPALGENEVGPRTPTPSPADSSIVHPPTTPSVTDRGIAPATTTPTPANSGIPHTIIPTPADSGIPHTSGETR